MSDSELDRAERKALYERVCRIADYQTDGPQPAGTTKRVIVYLSLRAGGQPEETEPAQVRRAIQAAVGNGDLVRWTDDGGTVTRYTPTTDQKLRKLHVEAAERGARELAGFAYQRLREVPA